MAMEMMQSSQKNASFPHSHSLGDDSGFPFFSRSFNFNLNEKCYLHARYFLLPTCPLAHRLSNDGFSRWGTLFDS
jgi:hypothetical protein